MVKVDRKPIMLCITQIADGGAERVMSYLANDLSEHGYDVILVTSFAIENEYTLSARVTREVLDDKEPNAPGVIRFVTRTKRLRRLCRKYAPYMIISFMIAPIVRSLIASRGLKIKNVISIRSDPYVEFRGLFGGLILRYLLPRADGFVFQTESAKHFFDESIQKRSCVIGNPIGEAFFNTKRMPIRGQIVTCGRLSEEKNQRLLIRAFFEVYKEYPFASLVIYGDGNMYESLRNEIEWLGLSQTVRLAGQVRDIPKAISTAEIFVLCSDTEGMPNALMEAMAMGIPCISTDCPIGGPRALIQNGNNGYLIAVNDLSALIDRLKSMLTRRDIADSMGMAARETAESYSRPTIMRCWRNYIDSFL